MYLEDVDLCLSMKKRGRTVLYIAGAEVLHYRGRSAPKNPDLERQAPAQSCRLLREEPPEMGAAVARLPETSREALTPMRIAIDARKLRDFGIGTYLRNILIELSRLDRDTEYVVLCRPDDVESGEVLGRNFRMVPETAPTYSIAEQFRIPVALAREGVRLVHEPHYVLPPLDPVPIGRDHSRLHPPDVSAIPAEQARVRLCEGLDVGGREEGEPHPDRLGEHRSATSCVSSTCRRTRSS